jgi:AraC-like DNA-binding protein
MPLQNGRLVDTRSVDEAREAIGRIFCPHFLTPTTAGGRGFHARHHAVRQRGYSVNYVSYGATVDIDPGELSRFFLLQIPVRGDARVRCGTQIADVSPGLQASILSPTLATRMTWFEGCEKLIVQIDREIMERQFGALSGHAGRPIEFATAIDLATPAGRALLRHVEMTFEAAENDMVVPEAYQQTLRDGLTTLLLGTFAHSGQKEFEKPAPAAGSAALRRAEAYILANLAGPLAAADIAAHAGVSLRSLQDAFRRSRDTTIGEFILDARLDLFRAALLEARGSENSVADAALAAGFGHLGRAAQAYRLRFGELPSKTLAERR